MSGRDGRKEPPVGGLALGLIFIVGACLFFSALDLERRIETRRTETKVASQTYCREASTKDCNELDAQVRSTNADEDAIDIGVWQMLMNFAGLVGLGCTVYYARGAYIAGQVSAKAATDALRHTEDVAAAQLRPYVFFAPDNERGLTNLTYEGRAQVLVKNFGQTPASGIRLRRGTLPVVRPIGDAEVPLNDHPEDVFGLAPGASQVIVISMSELTREQYDAFTDPMLPLVLLIRMRLEYDWKPGCQDSDDITFILCSEAAQFANLPKLGAHQRQLDKGG